jgi:hypothetical protein
MPPDKATTKSCKDDLIITPGKQSAARGYGCKMIPWVRFLFTRGGLLGGLAPSYYQAALPGGLRTRGESLAPEHVTKRTARIYGVVFLALGAGMC